MTTAISTDYLVVGCGATAMSFVDSLLDVSDADVVMVDRRAAPGGHWVDAYPFVRLHQPSASYGVSSTPFPAEERLQVVGPEAGMYPRAGGPEVSAYFDSVMATRLLASGRVRFFPMSEYDGACRFHSLVGPQVTEVEVRRAVVDATYIASQVPETYPVPFSVAGGATVVTPRELTHLRSRPDGFVVIGAGKTSMDTCTWLLEQGCPPDDITWIRPRDVWANNRRHFQPGHLASRTVEGTVQFVEAIAASATVDDVYARLEAQQVVYRLDPDVRPGVFLGLTLHHDEVETLRSIRRVVRLGRVRHLAPDVITLDHGSVPTSPGHVHVHCAAPGVSTNPGTPVFEEDRIVLQVVTRASASMSGAAIARIEALELPLTEKNRLSPPMGRLGSPYAYLQMLLSGLQAEASWRAHPELKAWIDDTRVNITRRPPGESASPELRELYGRLRAAALPAFENLARLDPRHAA